LSKPEEKNICFIECEEAIGFLACVLISCLRTETQHMLRNPTHALGPGCLKEK
jgi:hypothetical protein